MRIALITLAVAALAFIVGIIWIFAQKTGINLTDPPKNTQSEIKISTDAAALEILKSQWKTEEEIKNIKEQIKAIDTVRSNPVLPSTPKTTTESTSNTGVTTSTQSGSGSTTIIPISAKFLSRIIQKVSLTLDSNNGIFGLYVFDTNTTYSTYRDPKIDMTLIASRVPFETFLKNFQTIDPAIYSTPKPDGIVRIVMRVESQTLLISLPKSRFEEIKKLLLKK
jgi:hypothetical protein